MSDSILEIKNLKTYFRTEDGIARAVDGVSFNVERGKTLGVVGESGSGKSVTALSVMRLVSKPPGFYAGGEIFYYGKESGEQEDLLKVAMSRIRAIRGQEIAMIFQEPMTSLNPVFTIGDQIREAIITHKNCSFSQATNRTVEMLDLVGIPKAKNRLNDYPHQFSGGMRQRVMIAMALALDPNLLIADEPTTALDVTIQAQILDLMNNLKKELKTSIILITHDLGVVAEMCDKVAVMYAGQVVEHSDSKTLYKSPSHPYTRGLLGSIPKIGSDGSKPLEVIDGMVPKATEWPDGCRFYERCKDKMDRCKDNIPDLKKYHKNLCRCWLLEESK
ncbi:ABC transporter ATP-binding protein [Candidatus Riflebacteria bacterium]